MTTTTNDLLPSIPLHSGRLVCNGCGSDVGTTTTIDGQVSAGNVRTAKRPGTYFHTAQGASDGKGCRYIQAHHAARNAHNRAMLEAWDGGLEPAMPQEPAKRADGKPTRKVAAPEVAKAPEAATEAEPTRGTTSAKTWQAFMKVHSAWMKGQGRKPNASRASAQWKIHSIADGVPMAAEPEAPAPKANEVDAEKPQAKAAPKVGPTADDIHFVDAMTLAHLAKVPGAVMRTTVTIGGTVYVVA